MKQWYEQLFVNSGKQYDEESFTKGTLGECDFIEAEAGFDKSLRILDIGCGTGRHALELTRRGYHITGVDLSHDQLKRAREKALEQGLEIDFRQADARELPFESEFELAIMLCEGAFPLMETDAMNYQILSGAARALKPGGKLIFTTLNGLFPLFHDVEAFTKNTHLQGNAEYSGNSFDLMTFRDHNVTTATDDDGQTITLQCNERYYVPSEITWMLSCLGFDEIGIYGARLGEFSREHVLRTDDFEMLVVARKSG